MIIDRDRAWWAAKAAAEGGSEVGAGTGALSAPIVYVPRFIADPKAALEALLVIPWERRSDAPRCEYYCNDFDYPYTYGRGRGVREYERKPFPPITTEIRKELEDFSKSKFDALFLNMYTDARDHLGWHSDDSPEMDNERPIAIISLGAEREIWFRRRSRTDVERLTLGNGSLCLMLPGMQLVWEHRIPKASFQCSTRVSLTFRGFVKPQED